MTLSLSAQLSRTPRPVVALTAVVALVGLGAGACTDTSSGSSADTAAQATVTVTTTVTAQPEAADDPAVSVEVGSSGTTCFTRGMPRDIAWFDSQWKSTADLDEIGFRLVDGTGYRVIGSPVSIPPQNPGGAITSGGTIAWDTRSDFDDRFVVWSQRESTDLMATFAGQTGGLMFHLRMAPTTRRGDSPADLGTLEATWTQDGEQQTARAPVDQVLSTDPADCR
ncbi:hypothetical protein [Nocardioides acrostichi]|uniref:Uncharacterized protein n=1 Tax=Nocardioides acrostichi TaxID=2784339 RepID=A0A930Y8J6_9ACTN|nr:hypothetical protein [Nocardioides acrostichi]MBF4163131.1 hypothetical protein [Nocardioides acrostichi]